MIPVYTAYCNERYITEYDIPTSHSGPIGITVDPNGKIWFAETNVTKIAQFDPEDQTFNEYDIPAFSSRMHEEGAQIWGMTFDSKGNLWFTEATEAAIWQFEPEEATFERYLLTPSTVFPIQLIFDSEGNLWFTELFGDRIGKLDPSKVENNTRKGISEFSIPTPQAGASGLIFDEDGYLWFAESFSMKIARFDTREMIFKEYEMPRKVYSLVGITVDNEGRFWITDHGSSSIYRFDPQTGEFKEYSTSESPFFPVSLPYYIIRDSKGRIWTNEHYGNIIAVMDPDSEVLTEYEIPARDPRFGNISNVLHLTVDKEDNIWFTEWTSNKLGILDTNILIPFSIETSSRILSIVPGGNANITVKLNTDGMLDGPVRLYASGTFTTSGRLEGLEASFEPGELTPEQSVSTLTLKANHTLTPRVYTLMVGGKYQDVNRLVAIELVVGSPSNSSAFFTTWSLLLLAVSPLLFIALYVLYRRSK
jgi:virginiamycin B lyase